MNGSSSKSPVRTKSIGTRLAYFPKQAPGLGNNLAAASSAGIEHRNNPNHSGGSGMGRSSSRRPCFGARFRWSSRGKDAGRAQAALSKHTRGSSLAMARRFGEADPQENYELDLGLVRSPFRALVRQELT